VGRTGRVDVVVPSGAGAAPGTAPAAMAPGTARGAAEPLRGVLVSGNYFTVLGVRAAAGRTLTEADDTPADAGQVAVISDAFWWRRFARDPRPSGARC
jgi:membrane-bound ClpP family serine protease